MDAPPRRATALGAVAAFTALLLAAPSPARSLDVLRDPSAAGDPTGPLVAVVALLAWALAAWLLLTVALTLLSRVPGGVGRAARSAARRTAPAALRQLVGAALGVTVLAGAVAAPATASTGAPATSSAAAATVSLDWPGATTPDLDWPDAASATPETATPPVVPQDSGAASTPAELPDPPAPDTTDAPEPAPSDPSEAAPALDWPVPPPAPSLDWPDAQQPAPVLGAPTSTGAAADAVVVQPGDSLWSVAEDALAQERGAAPADAEVAAAWPSWWSANRDVVGDDPDLLLPGTALRPPPSDRAG